MPETLHYDACFRAQHNRSDGAQHLAQADTRHEGLQQWLHSFQKSETVTRRHCCMDLVNRGSLVCSLASARISRTRFTSTAAAKCFGTSIVRWLQTLHRIASLCVSSHQGFSMCRYCMRSANAQTWPRRLHVMTSVRQYDVNSGRR